MRCVRVHLAIPDCDTSLNSTATTPSTHRQAFSLPDIPLIASHPCRREQQSSLAPLEECKTIPFSSASLSPADQISSGEAIVRRLAKEGFRVCVNDVGANQAGIDKLVSDLNSQHGDNTAIGVAADVTSSSEVKKMVEQTVEKLGPLTVMVANAGIAQVTPVLEISDEDVQKMFNVNFMGVWNWYNPLPSPALVQ